MRDLEPRHTRNNVVASRLILPVLAPTSELRTQSSRLTTNTPLSNTAANMFSTEYDRCRELDHPDIFNFSVSV